MSWSYGRYSAVPIVSLDAHPAQRQGDFICLLDRHDVFVAIGQYGESHDAVPTARSPWEMDVGVSVTAEDGGDIFSHIREQSVRSGDAGWVADEEIGAWWGEKWIETLEGGRVN